MKSQKIFLEDETQFDHKSDEANLSEVFEPEFFLRLHKSHFLTLSTFSFTALLVYFYLVLQNKPLYFAESPDCTLTYFLDLYFFAILMIGVALVALVNYQTKIGRKGEPPIVFYDQIRNIFCLFGIQILYVIGGFVAQNFLCSANLTKHSENLVLVKLVAFGVHFLVGWNYFLSVFSKVFCRDKVDQIKKGSKKTELFTVTNGDKETRSEQLVGDQKNSQLNDLTLNLDLSDSSSVSGFTVQKIEDVVMQSTISADEMVIKGWSGKGQKKKFNSKIN